ncbi:DNA-3-methyladenine glycosylase [Silvanigrella paludirubra]|uniref:Putative 3-methyladenine DNA glycosylase n=1 Tax=Silvanigrella paludirubra TaxID=2499159 RepID=A0A6N6VP49_9BACT|nr:DNA-3-methyladenine glycosylase [Silvanigrella paludirubra]KAB8036804.1 DNA-3-methyladenine glycosylase [Silvanigrella paludirubra]
MCQIKKEFFIQNATEVAPKILGMKICRITKNGEFKTGIIVETEAYMQDDPACHAFNGITKRTAPMFEEGGISYVYLIYGIHYCLNIVTGIKGSGQAVLIRAIDLQKSSFEASGPGKLCKYLDIKKDQNGILFSKENNLWLEKGIEVPDNRIGSSHRVGISKGIDYNWRFFIKNNLYVSKLK